MNWAEVRVATRLVKAHARHHPGRMVLTTLSTIAAACVVVWVVSGYDALVEKFDEFSEEYLGRYELIVVPAHPNGESGFGNAHNEPLGKELIESLRKDQAIAALDPVSQSMAFIRSASQAELSDGREAKEGGESAPVERAGKDRAGKTRGSQRNESAGEVPPPGAVAASRSKDRREAFGKGPGGMGKGSPYFSNPVARMNRTPLLVGTNAAEPPYKLLSGRWIDPQAADELVAAISRGSAEQLGIKLDDEVVVTVPSVSGETRLKIVGIVEQLKSPPSVSFRIGLPPSRGPALGRGPANSALYVPLALAEKMTGKPLEFSFAGIVLKNGADVGEFRQRWMAPLAAASPPAGFQALAEVGEELESSSGSESMRMQAYSATGISLLAALFIIFTTLSMGVHERIRQFAVLRAVSLTKAQIGLMIAIESLTLGVIGWAGGLLAGWGLLTLVQSMRPEMFPDSASLGMWCVLLSGACALGGSLAAAIMPAWRATRVTPLDAMGPQVRLASARINGPATWIGLVLISINPLLVFFVPMKDTARYGVSVALGCTTMAVGFILLAPAAIILTEQWLGPLVARLLRLDPRLLASQLTTNLWRTLGTTVALTLGLGLFVAMQTWGYSMLGPYVPGDWVPDLLAGLTPTGVPLDQIDAVKQVKGVVSEKCLPLAVEQTKFADDVTGANERANSARQDNCVILGVDPDAALGGSRPMFDFRFVEGTRSEAISKLKQGRYCLVPDHFARESKLGLGDKFTVVSPQDTHEQLTYEIAGVVSMTGWHWMSKIGLRTRDGGRSAGLMFTGFEQVCSDYKLTRITFFWMNLDGSASEEQVQESLQQIAQSHYDPALARQRRRGMGRGPMPGFSPPGQTAMQGRGGSPVTVNVRTREGVRAAIRQRADGIIWAISQLPLVTLAVTSLGVVNTVLSSVRARRWDMGVLRALGVTRLGLFHLILAEALLVGIAACLLSLGFGILAGYCGTGLTRYMNVRGGQVTPLVVPWYTISIGFLITMGLCLFAALWPAFRTGRTEPLRLLQAGRTAD